MIISSEQFAESKPPVKDVEPKRSASQDDMLLVSAETAALLLTRSKFIAHHPKAGINPLVDSAAYLFSIIGRLKQIKSYRYLNKLHQELVSEINTFQDTAKARGYSSEYILVSRYALCATIDDIITNTSWGSQGQWDNYSLLNTFNQESGQQERFFVILERLIKDPSLYIDLMELMYLCLSLGFKGSYRSTEFSNMQLEQICNALYKRIRAHHGDFNKTLSPFPTKATGMVKSLQKKPAIIFPVLITASIILAIFIGLSYLLDTVANQAHQELAHIGKFILYENHDT